MKTQNDKIFKEAGYTPSNLKKVLEVFEFSHKDISKIVQCSEYAPVGWISEVKKTRHRSMSAKKWSVLINSIKKKEKYKKLLSEMSEIGYTHENLIALMEYANFYPRDVAEILGVRYQVIAKYKKSADDALSITMPYHRWLVLLEAYNKEKKRRSKMTNIENALQILVMLTPSFFKENNSEDWQEIKNIRDLEDYIVIEYSLNKEEKAKLSASTKKYEKENNDANYEFDRMFYAPLSNRKPVKNK